MSVRVECLLSLSTGVWEGTEASIGVIYEISITKES